MSNDMKEFYLVLCVFILLFVLIYIFIKSLSRRLSRWDDLALAFPMPKFIPGINFFKHCPVRAGRYSFSTSRNEGGLSIGFVDSGIVIKYRSSGVPSLLIPWQKVRSASKYSRGSEVTAQVEIDHDIPLSFYISGEGLSEFESRHKIDGKTKEQFFEEQVARLRVK